MTSDFWVLFTMGIIAFPSCADATPRPALPTEALSGRGGGRTWLIPNEPAVIISQTGEWHRAAWACGVFCFRLHFFFSLSGMTSLVAPLEINPLDLEYIFFDVVNYSLELLRNPDDLVFIWFKTPGGNCHSQISARSRKEWQGKQRFPNTQWLGLPFPFYYKLYMKYHISLLNCKLFVNQGYIFPCIALYW